ncbi:MAG: phosphatidate cytidylyltransferase [Holosporales bacterium]|jgi:phosphatidate cytidylyltransferase|nr:phosphatidate cytidylyltransferase [Holosporales bacterium]
MSLEGEKEHMVSELFKRTVSAIILGAVVVLSILEGHWLFQIFISVCTAMMLWEWVVMNNSHNKNAKMFLGGSCYIVVPMLFWIYESRYSNVLQRDILWIFTIVWSCDVFAYFGGKLLGGPKLTPKISPKKTWSGVVVGSIFSFAASYVFLITFFPSDKQLIIFSIPLIVASILGDLIESKVKRILTVKDSGNLIPGHGGILDRLDSFLLATYVFMIFKILFL